MTDASRYFVFVALTGDEQIRAYTMDPGTGALELSATSDAHGPIGALSLHPSGDLMHGAHVGSTLLSSYRLDTASGSLAHINSIDTGLRTPALSITDGDGRFLITGYYSGGGLTVHRLGDDGSIQDLQQRIDTGEKAHAVLIDESNRFVFIPHVCPNNKTSQFRFDGATGELTPNDPPELQAPDDNSGPRHMCFGPTGNVIYTVNEQGNHVTAQHLDRDRGTLEIFQHVPTLPAGYSEVSHCAHIEVHPSGKWLYASNRGPDDSIAGFEITSDATLTPIGHFPVHSSPRSFNIDPSGRFCYCAGESADRMRSFSVNQETGQLEPLDEYDVGASPFWVMALAF